MDVFCKWGRLKTEGSEVICLIICLPPWRVNSKLKILTDSYGLECHSYNSVSTKHKHSGAHRHASPYVTSCPFFKEDRCCSDNSLKSKADSRKVPKGTALGTCLCVVRGDRVAVRREQALQQLHLPDGHVGAKAPGRRSLSLFVGHFDASTYKPITGNAAFESAHLLLDCSV